MTMTELNDRQVLRRVWTGIRGVGWWRGVHVGGLRNTAGCITQAEGRSTENPVDTGVQGVRSTGTETTQVQVRLKRESIQYSNIIYDHSILEHYLPRIPETGRSEPETHVGQLCRFGGFRPI